MDLPAAFPPSIFNSPLVSAPGGRSRHSGLGPAVGTSRRVMVSPSLLVVSVAAMRVFQRPMWFMFQSSPGERAIDPLLIDHDVLKSQTLDILQDQRLFRLRDGHILQQNVTK